MSIMDIMNYRTRNMGKSPYSSGDLNHETYGKKIEDRRLMILE